MPHIAPSEASLPSCSPASSQQAAEIAKLNEWLMRYRESPKTFIAYRKELGRFVLWFYTEPTTSLCQLDENTLVEYFSFLADGNKGTNWVSSRPFRKDHPEWKAFIDKKGKGGGLSESSIRLSKAAVNGALSYLVSIGLLPSNPMQRLPKKSKSQEKTRASHAMGATPLNDIKNRRIPTAAWDYLLRYLDDLPVGETISAMQRTERSRFLIKMYFLTGLRLAELASALTADITVKQGEGQELLWTLNVVGKGGEVAAIPLTDEAMEVLAAYRTSHGLKPYPIGLSGPEKCLPIVLPVLRKTCHSREELAIVLLKKGNEIFSSRSAALRDKEEGKPRQLSLTPQAVWKNVSDVLKAAGTRAQAESSIAGPNKELQMIAATLMDASTHWLRHTAATAMLEGDVPIDVVQKMLRHKSIETTQIYLDTDETRQRTFVNKGLRLKRT